MGFFKGVDELAKAITGVIAKPAMTNRIKDNCGCLRMDKSSFIARNNDIHGLGRNIPEKYKQLRVGCFQGEI